MKLKVFLLITLLIIVIVYIILMTVSKLFSICAKPEYFEVEDAEGNRQNQHLRDAINAQREMITNLSGNIEADDPITDAHLPYSFNVYNKDLPHPIEVQEQNNFEYIIINTYKKILNRNPNEKELVNHILLFKRGELNEDLLRTYLLNSTEYAINSKTQSNDIDADIEYSFAKEDMMIMLSDIYFSELGVEVPKNMLLPLRDIFMYLDNDRYLLRALLINDNYVSFENEVINNRRLKKETILNIFTKYFVLDDIRSRANDIRRYDALNRQNTSQSRPQILPSNSNFMGADLETVSEDLGAGSGARWDENYDKDKLLDDLLKKINDGNTT